MRLDRLDFYETLIVIAPKIEKDESMARRSSGSSINPELRLAMALRLLAGAQYLDMIWYRVDVDHAWEYVEPVLEAIHLVVDNVKLPYSEEDIQRAADEWSRVYSRRSNGQELIKGILGATDGLVHEVTKRCEDDLNGKDPATYRNRKGLFALVAIAIVGAFTQFFLYEGPPRQIC